MGRPKKQESIKILEGTNRPDRLNTGLTEYTRIIETPDPPSTLDEFGVGIWCLLCEELIQAKMLMLPDVFALEVFVLAVQEYREACKKIQGRPKVIVGPSHKPMMNPWIKIRYKAADQIRQGSKDFGFTPLTRLKLTTPIGDDAPDPFAAFLDLK